MIKLILGDCLEKLIDIKTSTVDLVITSPPYNNWRNKRTQAKKKKYWDRTNIDYGTYNDKRSDKEYFDWQINILNELYRIIKDTGTIVYNHKDAIFNFKATSPLEWILQSKCIYRQRITWDRGGMQAFNPVRFYRVEEDIYILGKKAKGFKWNKECAKFLSIWKINPSSKKLHPASFPIEIANRSIKAFTNDNDLVLDPFVGSGTVPIACKQLHRNCIGIEIDRKYYEIAKKGIINVKNLDSPIPLFR